MALIKCSYCGQVVSDEYSFCQNCGRPVPKNGQSICLECGMVIPFNSSICPYCGCPSNSNTLLRQNDAGIYYNPTLYKKRKSSNIWIYPLASFLFTAIICLGYLWFNNSSKEKEVRKFTKQFAKAVKSKDNATIYRLYPDAKFAESFALSDFAEKMKIKKIGNKWKVTFDNGKNLTIARNKSDKSYYIKESHGMFSYPNSFFTLATKTGWYDPKLNDKENAVRLSDSNFTNWLNKKSKQYLNNSIKVMMATSTKGPDTSPSDANFSSGETFCTVVVTNTSDHYIAGNEYIISAQEKWTYWQNWDTPYYEGIKTQEKGKTKTLTGKPIPPNGTATYSWKGDGWYESPHSCYSDFKLSAYVSFTTQAEKSAQNHMNYTGNEYSQYLAEKGQ